MFGTEETRIVPYRIHSQLAGLAIAVAALVGAPNAHAQGAGESFKRGCEALKPGATGEGEALVSATYQIASAKRPAFCLVRATITTSPSSTINYRVDLPEAPAWNDKLIMVGGGGFDGYISLDGPGFDIWSTFVGYQGPNLGGYVLVSTDSGHQGRGANAPYDMSWAVQNPDALANHAWRANHLVLWAAVRMAGQFYGREPRRRYMIGGSNGGRQGIMAALRYPQDYNGILALEPAISQSGIFANMTPVFQHIYSHPDNWLGADALTLFTRAEVTACDSLDGLNDGVIGNYKACRYDGAPLACPARQPAAAKTCLTPGQIETIRQVRAYKRVDVALADGVKGYPGYGPGAVPSAWTNFLMSREFAKRDTGLYFLANQQVKVIAEDPNADIMTFDPLKSRANILAMSQAMDTTDPDLSAYFRAGGKMIVWHGVADTAVSYERTAEYIASVEKTVGAATMRKSLRYFVSPTLDHYLEGPEASSLPLLARLEDWVEKGKAPDRVIATRLDPAPSPMNLNAPAKVAFTRPLCESGTYPKYKGRGDTSKASSFACSAD
jgi:feruloyl esterase